MPCFVRTSLHISAEDELLVEQVTRAAVRCMYKWAERIAPWDRNVKFVYMALKLPSKYVHKSILTPMLLGADGLRLVIN